MQAIAGIVVSQVLRRSTTLQIGETTASGVFTFTFTEDGDLLRFEAPIVLLDEDATVPSTFPSPSPAG